MDALELQPVSSSVELTTSLSAALKALESVERTIARKVVRKATRAAAKVVLPAAKSNVPVATGALRKSLKVRALPRRRYQIGHRIVTGTREELGIDKDAEGYYPSALEYGYQRNGKFIPAHPYLRPALHSRRGAAQAVALRELRNGTNAAARAARARFWRAAK